MTESRGGRNVVVGVSGAWKGEATDPERSFLGEINVSELEALPVGTSVEVTYQDSGRRVTGPGEHGMYLLRAGEHSWRVLRFTAHPSAAGQARDDRVPSGDWVAELVER
ncbi:hypothetical protein LAJ19_12435 [Deinococcus taeanensis]|uniref:hypothetical protein n=1 Tax=Deinococcus taeanensis TaxID=2737050 RepID=UPI001CDCBAA8|nr:hypothetical protein [Deinococcus taeanensis]UBV42421.1 hypothetical protein LAJ19_12435 [Deinococcus taeanensis]